MNMAALGGEVCVDMLKNQVRVDAQERVHFPVCCPYRHCRTQASRVIAVLVAHAFGCSLLACTCVVKFQLYAVARLWSINVAVSPRREQATDTGRGTPTAWQLQTPQC